MEVNATNFGSSDNLQILYSKVDLIDDRAKRGQDIRGSFVDLKNLESEISEEIKLKQNTFWSWYKSTDLDLLSKLQSTVEGLSKLIIEKILLPDDVVQNMIFILSDSPKQIYNLSLVSKKFSEFYKADKNLEKICFKISPEFKKSNDVDWKSHFKNVICINEHKGSFLCRVISQAGTIYTVGCNDKNPLTSVLHFKKIIKLKANLDTPINDMILVLSGRVLADDILLQSLDLRSYAHSHLLFRTNV